MMLPLLCWTRRTRALAIIMHFGPLLTFMIMLAHDSQKCKKYKKAWRMGRKYKRFSFCVESVLCYFFFSMATMTEYESVLNLSHSGSFMWLLAGCKTIWSWTKRPFLSPCDNCAGRLTHFMIVPRLSGTHSFSWHTFSCSLSGLQPFTVLSLSSSLKRICMQTLEELTGIRKSRKSTHMSMWFWLSQKKTLQNILVSQEF